MAAGACAREAKGAASRSHAVVRCVGYREWYIVVRVIVACGVVGVCVCRKQEQVRLTRMDMRTRVQAWAVAFVSLLWSPSVVVMISRCPAARSNATRPATPGMIIDDDDDDLFGLLATAILRVLPSSSLSLHSGLFIMSSIDHVPS